MDGMDKVFKGEATFFIAEIGINHNGSRDEALSMVEAPQGRRGRRKIPDIRSGGDILTYTELHAGGDAKPSRIRRRSIFSAGSFWGRRITVR